MKASLLARACVIGAVLVTAPEFAADLPPAQAERIAWRNGDALFASWKPAAL